MVQAQQQAPEFEEHGGLGKAIAYFLKHYDGLTLFCKVIGVPLDNNIQEEALKMPIKSRKNSYFYKTQTGADVANILMSLITTAYRNASNPFDYLVLLQRHRDEVKAQPHKWLPWNAPMELI